MSQEPRKDPEYLQGLEKAKKKKTILNTFNKAIEEALEAFAGDMAMESDASPASVLGGGDGSYVARVPQSPGRGAAMLPDTDPRRENGAHRRAGRSNACSSVDADDPFTAALKRRQAALGLTQVPTENDEKHGLTPAWVITVAVKVFGLEIVGGKPEWLRGPPNGEKPAPLDSSSCADVDPSASGSSPLPAILDAAAPDAIGTHRTNASEDPDGASPGDLAMDGDTSGKAFPCAEQPPRERDEEHQPNTTQGFETTDTFLTATAEGQKGTETIRTATNIRPQSEEACVATVSPEGDASCCIPDGPADSSAFVNSESMILIV